MTNPLVRLGELGQSPWYDHITRDLVAKELTQLIADDGLRGMTSNPTIFEKAVSGSRLYDEDLRRLAAEGRGAPPTSTGTTVTWRSRARPTSRRT